jgi:hypothetical protein
VKLPEFVRGVGKRAGAGLKEDNLDDKPYDSYGRDIASMMNEIIELDDDIVG